MHVAERLNKSKPDDRSPEQIALDRDFPQAKPNDYIVNWGLPASPELKAADESASTWLSSAGFDQQFGNSLVNTIEQVSRQTSRMSPSNWKRLKIRNGSDCDRCTGSTRKAVFLRRGAWLKRLNASDLA